MPDRARLLETAAEYVLRQRNKSYGEPDEDFQRIAAIANGLGFRFTHGDVIRQLNGSDVALFMISLKLARLAWSPDHEDSWIDIAGYAACGMETANLEEVRRQRWSNPDPDLDDVSTSNDAMVSRRRAAAGDDTVQSFFSKDGRDVETLVSEKASGILKIMTAGMVDAAQKAVSGDPKELEEMGLMLVDAPHASTFIKPCYKCILPDKEHEFSGLCVFRIAERRKP
jgi:hypothetical protein